MNMFLPARLTHVSHACTGTHTSTHLDSGWVPSTPLFYICQLSSSCKGERKTGRTKQADKCLQKHLYAWGRNGASDAWYSNVHSAVQQAYYMCTSLCIPHYMHKQLSIKGHKPNTPHLLCAMYIHIHLCFCMLHPIVNASCCWDVISVYCLPIHANLTLHCIQTNVILGNNSGRWHWTATGSLQYTEPL